MDWFGRVWGLAFGLWALAKFLQSTVPMVCGPPPPVAQLAPAVALFEGLIGMWTMVDRGRHLASLLGLAFSLGLVLFAFVADYRGLPWKGCGCVWMGVDFAWLPGHALLAVVLAAIFGTIFVHEERRARAEHAALRSRAPWLDR